MPFYAVKEGRQRGVFSTWAECEQHVKGFAGARYKKFATQEEAVAFAGSSSDTQAEPVKKTRTAAPERGAWYAVRRGRETGVFASWDECQRQVSGFPGAVFKKFSTHEDAAEFVISAAASAAPPPNPPPPPPPARPRRAPKRPQRPPPADLPPPVVVYTDGGCFNNGRRGAKAGYGVWWGPRHPWNESRRLDGEQTNNRAEIEAAIAAVQRAEKEGVRHLEVRTDSRFLINCITSWVHQWRKNGWVLSDKTAVKVRGPIERLDSLLRDSAVYVAWEYVPGHRGVHGNEAADRLARKGVAKELHK